MKTKPKRIKFKDASMLNSYSRVLVYLAIRNYILKKSGLCALIVSPLILFSALAAFAFNYNTTLKISVSAICVIAFLALYTPITLMLLRELKAIKTNKYQYHIGKIDSEDKDHTGFRGLTNVIVVDSIMCDCVHEYKTNKKNEKYIVIRTDVGRMPLAIKYDSISKEE